jgi:hypothetical protein
MASVTNEMQTTDTIEGLNWTYGNGMSNCGHGIEEGLEGVLRANPGTLWAGYAGWYFHGRVWFKDDLFHVEVWQHRQPVEVLTAATLQGIMDVTCAEYGPE